MTEEQDGQKKNEREHDEQQQQRDTFVENFPTRRFVAQMATVLAANGLFYSPVERLVRCCSCFAGQSVPLTVERYVRCRTFVDRLVHEVVSNLSPAVTTDWTSSISSSVSSSSSSSSVSVHEEHLFPHDTYACPFAGRRPRI